MNLRICHDQRLPQLWVAGERLFCTCVSPGRAQEALGLILDRFCSSLHFDSLAFRYSFHVWGAQWELLRTARLFAGQIVEDGLGKLQASFYKIFS